MILHIMCYVAGEKGLPLYAEFVSLARTKIKQGGCKIE